MIYPTPGMHTLTYEGLLSIMLVAGHLGLCPVVSLSRLRDIWVWDGRACATIWHLCLGSWVVLLVV